MRRAETQSEYEKRVILKRRRPVQTPDGAFVLNKEERDALRRFWRTDGSLLRMLIEQTQQNYYEQLRTAEPVQETIVVRGKMDALDSFIRDIDNAVKPPNEDASSQDNQER